MQRLIVIGFKVLRRLFQRVRGMFDWAHTWGLFYLNNASFSDFSTNGFPYVSVAMNGELSIGSGLSMNNGMNGNPIGRPQPCVFFVGRGAEIRIGKNVGMSSVALFSQQCIVIDDNAIIGGGVCIYDTDFHSLNAMSRRNVDLDRAERKTEPVRIGKDAFIGGHVTILKGVTIGESSIVGACSVVTKSIPAGELWAGNPARFIRRLSDE